MSHTSALWCIHLRWTFRNVLYLLALLMCVQHTAVLGCRVDCRKVLTSSNGVFTSPCYPSEYPNSQACKWTLQAPAGYIIQITFLDFEIEEAPQCIYDHVTVSSGKDDVKFCGITANGLTLNSTGNVMNVSFTTDFSVQKKGFKISYKQVAVSLRNQKLMLNVKESVSTATSVTIPNLEQFTVCFEATESVNSKENWIFFSYKDSSSTELLTFEKSKSTITLTVLGANCDLSNAVLNIELFSKDMQLLCLTWDGTTGYIAIYTVNTYENIECPASKSKVIPSNGVFSLGPSSKKHDSFTGGIYNFRLWKSAMNTDMLSALTCDEKGDVIDWENEFWNITASYLTTDENLSCVCSPNCKLTTTTPSSGTSLTSSATVPTTSCSSSELGCPVTFTTTAIVTTTNMIDTNPTTDVIVTTSTPDVTTNMPTTTSSTINAFVTTELVTSNMPTMTSSTTDATLIPSITAADTTNTIGTNSSQHASIQEYENLTSAMNVNNSTEREKTDSTLEHPGPHVIPGARSSKTALGIISTPLIWPVRKKQDPVTHSQERPVIYMTKPEIVVTQNMPAVAAKHNVTVRKHVQQGTKNGSYDTTADFPKETFLRQHKNNESDRVEPLQTTSLSSRKNKQNAPYWDLQDTGENNTLNQTEPLDYSSGSEPAVYEVDIRGGMFNGTDASAAFSSYEMDSSFILHDTVPLNRSGNTAQYNITEENNNLMNVTRITDSQSQSFYHFPSDLPLQGSLVTYSSITEINLFSSLRQQMIVDNVLLPLSVTGKQTVHLNFTSAQQTVPSVPPVSRDTYLQSPRVSIRPTKPVLLSEYNGNIFSLPGIISDYQHITTVTTTTAEATEPVKDELNPQSLSSNFMNSTFLPPNRDISSSRKEPVHNPFSFTSNNEQADSPYRVFPSNPVIPPSQMPIQQFNEIPKTVVKASSEIQSKILMLEPSRLGNSLQSHVFEVYSSMTYAYLATHSQFFATFISGTPSNLIVSDSTQSYTINNQFVENIPRSAIPIENLSLTTLVGMSSKSSISLNTAAPLMYMSLLSTTEKITSFHSSHLYLFSQSSEGRLDKSASYITYVSNSKTDSLPVDSVLQGKGLMISKPVSEGADYFNIVPQSWTFLNSSSTHVSDGTYLSRIYPLPKIKEHFTLSHSIHKTTFTGYLSASNLELEKYMSPSSALYSTNDFQQKPFSMLHTINVSSQEKREYHMSAFRDFNKSDVYLKVSSPPKVFLPEFYSSTTMPHSVSPEPANTFNLKPVQTETLNLKEAHSALAYLTPLLLESPQLVTDKEPGTTKPSIIPRTVTTFFKDTVKNITHGRESVNTNFKDWTARTSIFPTIVKETSILHVDSVSQHSQIRNSSDSSRYDGSSSVSGADARSPLEDSTIAESSTNNFTLPSTQHPVSTINVSANTVIGNISHAANPHTIQTVLLSHTESKPTTGYPTKDPHTLIPPNRTSEAFAGGVHTISATGSLTAVGLTAFSSCQCKVRFDITCQCGFAPNNKGVFYRISFVLYENQNHTTAEQVEQFVSTWLNQTFQNWTYPVYVANVSVQISNGVSSRLVRSVTERYICQALLVYKYVNDILLLEESIHSRLVNNNKSIGGGLLLDTVAVHPVENCDTEENPFYYKWPESRPTVTQYLPCFPNKALNASRTCMLNLQNYTSYWGSADLINCTGDIDSIAVSAENAADVATQLVDITNHELTTEEVTKIVTKLNQIISVATINASLASKVVAVFSNVLTSSDTALAASSPLALKTVDDLTLKILFSGPTLSITSKNLALGIAALNSSTFNGTSFNAARPTNASDLQVSFESDQGDPLAAVILPATLLNNLSETEIDTVSRVQFTFYSKTGLFQDQKKNGLSLNSYVVASSVGNASISNLQDPVKIQIQHTHYQTKPNPVCVFWDFTLQNDSGGWNADGCTVSPESNRNKTVCLCNHLTHFGVLMDISGAAAQIDAKNTKILTIITYIGCGISAIFSAATLITYIAFEKLRRDYPSKILMNLSTALLFLNMVFLIDGWLATFEIDGLCIAVAVFLHFFLLTSFTWMGLEAVHMYIALVKVFNTYIRRYILKFCIVGWGLPAVTVAIVVAIDRKFYGKQYYGKGENGEGSSEFCWVKNQVVFYVTCAGYFGIVFLMNVAMFIVVMVQICGRNGKRSNRTLREEILRNLRSVISLTFLLGMTWGFAFFAWGPVNLAFMYLFAIFNSLQGLFIFIFHCALKENVQKQWRRYLCFGRFRLADNSDWSKTATNNTKKASSDNLGKSLSSSSTGSSSTNWKSKSKAILNPFAKRNSNTGNMYGDHTSMKSGQSEGDQTSIIPVHQVIDKVKGYCSVRSDNFYKNIIMSDSFSHSTKF